MPYFPPIRGIFLLRSGLRSSFRALKMPQPWVKKRSLSLTKMAFSSLSVRNKNLRPIWTGLLPSYVMYGDDGHENKYRDDDWWWRYSWPSCVTPRQGFFRAPTRSRHRFLQTSFPMCRGPKSLNFPDGNFQRAKTFRKKCVNRFCDKKTRKSFWRQKNGA